MNSGCLVDLTTTSETEAHDASHEYIYLCRAGREHSPVAQRQAVHILYQGLRSVVLPDVFAAAVVRVHGEPFWGLPAAAGSHLSLADVRCTIKPAEHVLRGVIDRVDRHV